MRDDNKPVYILCPRCELNYIEQQEDHCTVCKAEMGIIDPSILIPDEEEEGIEKLCPVCKVNYIGEDEGICFLCKKEKDAKEATDENDDSWLNFVDDTPDVDDGIELSLSELAEEEEEDEDEDETVPPDDFDFEDVSPDDFFDDDEELEDEEEEPEDDEE